MPPKIGIIFLNPLFPSVAAKPKRVGCHKSVGVSLFLRGWYEPLGVGCPCRSQPLWEFIVPQASLMAGELIESNDPSWTGRCVKILHIRSHVPQNVAAQAGRWVILITSYIQVCVPHI